MASISARLEKVSLEEIYSLLLTMEARISRHQPASPIHQASIIVAQKQYRSFTNRGRGNYRGRGRGNRGGFTNNTRSNDQASIICQVCNKPGHSARKCYHHFDLAYQDSVKTKNKQVMVAANGSTWNTE